MEEVKEKEKRGTVTAAPAPAAATSPVKRPYPTFLTLPHVALLCLPIRFESRAAANRCYKDGQYDK